MALQTDVLKCVLLLQTIMDIWMFVSSPVPMDGTEITQPDYVYNNVQYNLFYSLIIPQILVLNIALQTRTFSQTTLPESVFFIVVLDYLLKSNQDHALRHALKIS